MRGLRTRYAKGRRRQVPSAMNRTEAQYAQHLEARKKAGEVLDYLYEGVKFKLAPATFYTPDFFVMLADCVCEVHEVKGHWEDDARVKLKVAAERFPFRFVAVKPRKDGGWDEESF